jgi:hypothetical protein
LDLFLDYISYLRLQTSTSTSNLDRGLVAEQTLKGYFNLKGNQFAAF